MAYRVLFISDISLSPFTTLTDRMLIRGLRARGVDITVVTQRPVPETQELEEEGVKVEYIIFDKKISRSVITRLRSIIDKEKTELIHVTFGKAMTNAIMAARGRKVKIIGYYGSLSLHWHDPSAWLTFLSPRIDRLICASDAVEAHAKNSSRRGGGTGLSASTADITRNGSRTSYLLHEVRSGYVMMNS